MNEYVKSIYMVNVQEFGTKATAFSLNPNSTDITDEFSEEEILGSSNNNVKKLEKVYDDLYKYVTWEEVEEHLGKADNKRYSSIAKGIGLEVSPFSDKFDKLDKKFNKENIEKNVEKHINIEKSIEKEKKNEKDF